MNKYLSLILVVFVFISCNPNNNAKKKGRLIFTNDCESLDGWNNNTYPVSSENFHSGRYSNKLNAQSPYSVTFRYKYGDLSSKKIKSVKISVWAYFLTNNYQNKAYVIDIDSLGHNVFWSGNDMREFVKSPKTWTKIEKVINFPRRYDPNCILSIYGWNSGEGTILLDDFEIEFSE